MYFPSGQILRVSLFLALLVFTCATHRDVQELDDALTPFPSYHRGNLRRVEAMNSNSSSFDDAMEQLSKIIADELANPRNTTSSSTRTNVHHGASTLAVIVTLIASSIIG
jgi:hypothetical protein